MTRGGVLGAVLAAALGLLAPGAHAVVISVSALKDNTLYEDPNGSLSNGAGQRFFAGRAGSGGIRRGLLTFDVAGSVPAGSTINGAALRLNMSNTTAGPTPVELHRALRDWGEGASVASGGEGGGAPAAPGDATWIHTFFNTGFWTTAGGDYSATASAGQSVGGVGVYAWSSVQLAADVQTWLDNPALNFGWVLLGDESFNGSAKRFDSRENTVPANRPLLTVDYTPVPEPSSVTLCGIGTVALAFKRRASRHRRQFAGPQ